MSGGEEIRETEGSDDREWKAEITPRSSVDYALRNLHQSLVQLSSMADQKANIVLGASLIMITIIVGLASSNGITASMAVLGLFAVGSSICALLAVMPSTGKNPQRRNNPFYFGDIAHLDDASYRELVEFSFQTDEHLYGEMLRDLREQSRVLQHGKFRYLRWSYGLFIVGLVVTSATMAIELVID